MKWIRLLLYPWPIGHFVLKKYGWHPFTARRRRHWWYIPWYQKGIVLRPYREALARVMRGELDP